MVQNNLLNIFSSVSNLMIKIHEFINLIEGKMFICITVRSYLKWRYTVIGKYLESSIFVSAFVQLCIRKFVTIFLLIVDHNGDITIDKGYFLQEEILIDFFRPK